MLAAGYPPSALGLVPPSPIIQPSLPDPMSSTAPSSLNLASISSTNHNEISITTSVATPSINSANQKSANELTTSPSTSVLQQRLSTPIESLTNKDTTRLNVATNSSMKSPIVLTS